MARTGIERASVKDLIPDPQNPNRSNERGASVIEQSLERLGAGRSIVVDKNNKIVAGNQTAKAFQKLGKDDIQIIDSDGSKLVVVRRTDLDLEQGGIARELSLADNRTQELSYEVDPAIFAGLDESIDLSWMYTADELAAILAQNSTTELLTDEDAVPDPPKVPKSKRGQVWILGRHRLMCGDSTNAEDVSKLMDGAKADMVFTDPPYGISIVQGNKVGGCGAFGGKKNEAKGAKRIEVHNFAPIIGDSTTETAVAAYKLCESLSIKTLIFWGANHYSGSLPSSSCWLVWDKENSGNFADGELAWTNQKTAVRIFRHMWNGMVKASEHGQSRVHPTQKPVALAAWAFGLYSKERDKVLDLFGGSGSTLIACEKTNRSCYMMEMSEAYVDVIITRWENATGQKAVLHGTKEGNARDSASKHAKEQAGRPARAKRQAAPANGSGKVAARPVGKSKRKANA
jgi:16S rRNA G966 N2-methylase RsmD